MGEISCLTVGDGDITIQFDTNNTAEAIRAKRMIMDMLKRGYALLIEVDGAYQRATGFDEKIGCYIVADFDSTVAFEHDLKEVKDGETETQEKQIVEATPKLKGGRRKTKNVPMEKTRAVAVARTAGG